MPEPKPDLSYRFLDFLSSLLARLPHGLALKLGKWGGMAGYYFSSRRKSAYADIKSAFGDKYNESQRRRIVRAQYAHLGQMGMEMLRFPSLDQKYVETMVTLHHSERAYQAMDEGKGVIFLTAHIGNWELSQIIAGILGKPIYVLARTQKQKYFNEMLNRLRQSHGSKAVTRGMGIRELYRALKKGGLIGILGDRDAGREEGLILPFFGRKTSVPTGAFEMARRTGAPILPSFDLSDASGKHNLYVEEPIHCGQGDYVKEDLIPQVEKYLSILEDLITRYPEQWLWLSKRWKFCWTKRVVILSDGKAGHRKQSEALYRRMSSLQTQFGRPGVEYSCETIEVAFKSKWHRKLFPWFAFFFIPWAQGRLPILSFFFKPETQKQIRNTSADFILSSGSGLIPLNLCLAKESNAKTVVMMKPSFPFNLFRYDLAVIPAHDEGRMPKETFRTLLTPSPVDADSLKDVALRFTPKIRSGSAIKYSFFVGGNTREFKLELSGIEQVLSVLDRLAPVKGDYLVTTSRRTPETIGRLLKSKQQLLKGCRKMVIASEDPDPDVAGGMMALAEVLIVTEDSISMISEAVSTGKKVLVLSFPGQLPAKHHRFKQLLLQKSAIKVSTAETLERDLRGLDEEQSWSPIVEEENAALEKRLQAIL